MDFLLHTNLRKIMTVLILSVVLVISFSRATLAADYNILSWDSFNPADGAKVTSTTVSIAVSVSDWDSITSGTLKMYIDNSQVPAQVTLTDGEGGGW